MPSKRTIPRICETCGANFLGRADRVRNGGERFCSRPCIRKYPQGFDALVDRQASCWPWIGTLAPNGYGRFDGTSAHRKAWVNATGAPIPEDMHILHTCDVKRCVRNDEPGIYFIRGIYRPRFGHLWLGTHEDNMADRDAKGRTLAGDLSAARMHPDRLARGDRHGSQLHPERVPRGQSNGMAKLTDDQVRIIRLRYQAGGISQPSLAREFGITQATLWRMLHRLTWKHVE